MCGLASRTASASVSATYTMFVMTTSSGFVARPASSVSRRNSANASSCWRIGTNTTE